MLVDRLEELLAMMEDEDENEEGNQREDGSALRPWTAPAARALEKDGADGPPGMPGELPDGPNGPDAGEADRTVRETETMDGPDPVWPGEKGGAAVEAARYRALRERLEEAEEGLRTAKANGAQAEGESAAAVRGGSGTGLEGLYRQTVRAARPAPQALPVEQTGRTVRAEEPGRTAALTVDELDRAVRRDSRRYDGGMTIF